MSIECSLCGTMVELDESNQCPSCGARIPRFLIETLILPDESFEKSVVIYKDPIKRREAEMALRFWQEMQTHFFEEDPFDDTHSHYNEIIPIPPILDSPVWGDWVEELYNRMVNIFMQWSKKYNYHPVDIKPFEATRLAQGPGPNTRVSLLASKTEYTTVNVKITLSISSYWRQIFYSLHVEPYETVIGEKELDKKLQNAIRQIIPSNYTYDEPKPKINLDRVLTKRQRTFEEPAQIQCVVILNKYDEIFTQNTKDGYEIDLVEMQNFAHRVKEVKEILIETKDPIKIAGKTVGLGAIIIYTDSWEKDSVIIKRLNNIYAAFRLVITGEAEYQTFMDKFNNLIKGPKNVGLLGAKGVGKSTINDLINLNATIPNLGFLPLLGGSYTRPSTVGIPRFYLEIITWEEMGLKPVPEEWKSRLRELDGVILVTDSTKTNVKAIHQLLVQIQQIAPLIVSCALANHQDRWRRMRPTKIEKILGIPTFGLKATNRDCRNDLVRFLNKSLTPQ